MNKNPSYHVITLECVASEQEQAQSVLYNHGCLGLEEESSMDSRVKLRCYFDANEPLSEFKSKITQWLPQATITMGTTIDLNSIQAMIPTFEPVEILPNIFIIPPEDVPHKETITEGKTLIIRPGMGFGTGRHETTQLVLSSMNQYGQGVQSLLDVGSGSGVLSIFGESILGIPEIDAVEIDEHARENAAENYALNNIRNIKQFSNINDVASKKYDLIVANIISSTLIFLKPKIVAAMHPQTTLILSGILESEKTEILEAFKELKLVATGQQKEWISLVFGSKADQLT